MNYPFFLARRLSLAGDNGKSSPAVKVAITAVALSVGVMIAAIAIVLGFKREIRDKVLGFNSHITVYAAPENEFDDNLITLTPSLRKILDSQPYIESYSLEASIPAILKTKDNFKGTYLKSLEGNNTHRFIANNLEEGVIPDFSKKENNDKIIISRLTANQLNLSTGDRIDTYFITESVKVRRLTVAGIFNSHFDNYDNVYIYGALPLIQALGGIDEKQGTSLQLTVNDISGIEEDSYLLHNALLAALENGNLYKYYRVDNALNQGAGYFRWLSLLDTNVIVILVLMTFVACITLISGMLILILDKKNFIGLIRSLGAPSAKVRRIFVWLAIKVAAIGLVIGNLVMLLLLYCQNRWHIARLDPDAYYIDFVPVEFSFGSFLLLNAAVIIVIYLSLILPSWFVAGISPSETMRYE